MYDLSVWPFRPIWCVVKSLFPGNFTSLPPGCSIRCIVANLNYKAPSETSRFPGVSSISTIKDPPVVNDLRGGSIWFRCKHFEWAYGFHLISWCAKAGMIPAAPAGIKPSCLSSLVSQEQAASLGKAVPAAAQQEIIVKPREFNMFQLNPYASVPFSQRHQTIVKPREFNMFRLNPYASVPFSHCHYFLSFNCTN